MQKYLITGGEGFIGSKITSKVNGTSYDIKSGFDILDKNKFAGAAANVDGIFHCAAKISVPESFQLRQDYNQVNVIGTRNVIEIAKQHNLKVVFSSSAAVYGDSSIRVSEESDLNPKSPYAENKKDAEKLLEVSGISCVILRYFNVYGPGQSQQYAGVITSFILKALRNEDLTINGDGKQVRDFVFIDDVVRANILAMERKNPSFEVFNIGSGTETSIEMLAKTIIKLTNSSSRIVYSPPRDGDIIYSQADVSKVNNILGWTAKQTLEDGLKQTIEYYSNN